jgi:hypothetical protein
MVASSAAQNNSEDRRFVSKRPRAETVDCTLLWLALRTGCRVSLLESTIPI